jgi:exo-1,4-beta-D-glucosaminidase
MAVVGILATTLWAAPVVSADESEGMPATAVSLNEGWQIQSSCEVKAGGEQVSQPGFATSGWHNTTVPNTVVGSLVDDKTYPDPAYGTNLKQFPGMNYSDKNLFANQDMPEGSPFKCSWWWRLKFTLLSLQQPRVGDHYWLHFPGINYRANVWLNGKKIADAKDVAGTFRIFEFDVTAALNPSGANAVALEIFAPEKNDLGITWVDWNPTPADKDMGIWKEVTLTSNGPVAIRNVFVTSKLDAEYKWPSSRSVPNCAINPGRV